MAIALNGPIPDSERFTELAETPPPVSPTSLRTSYIINSNGNTNGKSTPPRPRRSSQRGLQIFTPATLKEKLEEHNRSRNNSIIDLYAGSNNGAEEDNNGNEEFYSPLSSPALVGTIHQTPPTTKKQRNRTSEIPVLPNSASGKEAGVKRAFRSKVGTDGSISLSILPTAAALSEMLGSSTTPDLPLSTYKPSAGFAKSTSSLTGGGGGKEALRRGSAASTGSVNTKPLTIRRKKPAIYNPQEDALPVSRAASIDVATPITEDYPLPLQQQQQNSPRRRSDLALPVTQTFMTPLRSIPQSDITPPATPPTWTGSTQSDTYTEEDSMPVSPRSSANRTLGPSSSMKGRRLQHGQPSVASPAKATSLDDNDQEDLESNDRVPAIPRRPTNDHVDLDFLMPYVCSLDEMQDRPGMLRRDSDDSTDFGDEDEDDDEEDVQNFGLESFPVPSVVLSSAKNTPRMYPLSPTLVDNLTASPTQRKASIASTNSRLRPKTDLYPIPTDADGNQEWDQATELEIRDRVFRAEIKKPNKADKARRKALQKVFDQLKRPTKMELYEASLLSVRDENGHKVRFGTLFEEKKTIVCFIRHFWCSQCQNYVDAIAKVRPEVLAKHNMNLVIVSNGSWKMIKAYRKMLGNRCPYPIYTDRAKHIYTALGMTLRSWDAGKGPEVGSYIQHSLGASVIAGIKSGAKLPLKPPGDQQQLGGEFILGPGLNIHFCHRMKTTRGHAEIEDVLASAGIDLDEENRALGLMSGSATPTMKSSAGKEAKANKRLSAMTYSNSSNGVSSSQGTPSLAASIMNRLNNSSPKLHSSSVSSPKQPHSPTMSSSNKNTTTTSPPGSPLSAHFANGGISSPPTRSRRLVKKNRKSTQDLAGTAVGGTSSATTQTSPLGVSSSTSVDGLFKHARHASSPPLSTLSGTATNTAEGRQYHSPLFADGDAERLGRHDEEEPQGGAVAEDKQEEMDDRTRKHSSAPPVIPTPISITPLSTGFLQVPSRNNSGRISPPTMYSKRGSTESKPDSIRRRSISQPNLYIKPTAPSIQENGHVMDDHTNEANGYICVNGKELGDSGYDHGDAIQSQDIRPCSSRFSESSNEDDHTMKSKNQKSNKKERESISKRTSGSSTSLSRPKSFVRSLTLRSSNSSLKSRPSLLRVDSSK